MTALSATLERVGACGEAIRFYESEDSTDERSAWSSCKRGDWMLWLIVRAFHNKPPESPERRLLTLVAVECAATALPQAKDSRVVACLITAWRWGIGDLDVTLDDVHEARAAAAAAAYAADAAADAAAAAAAAYAADAAARLKRLAECADIVRLWFPAPDFQIPGLEREIA